MSTSEPVRVALQQPSLAKYRLPVYRELALRPGIRFHLYYGSREHLTNVAPEGFEATYVPLRQRRLLGREVRWHSAQWRLAERRMTDVLILSWDLHYASLVPALLRARRQGVATILWGHGYSKNEAAWRAWPRRNVTRLATALLFYNQTSARSYVEAGVDAKRIFVALNALDQDPIQDARSHWLSQPDRLAEFRRSHGVDGAKVILFVSRLQRDNRLDLLLEAVSRFGRDAGDVKLVVVGKGPDEERIRTRISELAIEDRVLLSGAIYDEMALAPWFLSASAFCYPVNVGLSILHSFGYGLPIVTSDRTTAQNPEIEALEPGENGLVYQDGSVESLVEQLARVLNDQQLKSRLGEAAHRTATQRFTLRNMVDGFEQAIRFAAAAVRGAG